MLLDITCIVIVRTYWVAHGMRRCRFKVSLAGPGPAGGRRDSQARPIIGSVDI